jgi:hypothetical protein
MICRPDSSYSVGLLQMGLEFVRRSRNLFAYNVYPCIFLHGRCVNMGGVSRIIYIGEERERREREYGEYGEYYPVRGAAGQRRL